VGNAANGTAAIMRDRLTCLVGLAGRSHAVMTDEAGRQRIGGSHAGSPTRRDWRKDLHRQGKQDDWKEFP
jgi:hypothetical protein